MPARNQERNAGMNQRPPEKLPDPWLFDSESLLRELDRCRELVLEIPITNPNATHFGINVAVTAIWNLTRKPSLPSHIAPRSPARIRKAKRRG
jgi:hypothetical protein